MDMHLTSIDGESANGLGVFTEGRLQAPSDPTSVPTAAGKAADAGFKQ